MNNFELKDSISNFIYNDVVNYLEREIYEKTQNFDYSDRCDIHVKCPDINYGSKIISISALREIDYFDDNHDTETQYFLTVSVGGKNETSSN